jgi:hypothetical protein
MTMTFEESLRAIEAELRALSPEELRMVNVDTSAAAIQGIRVARRVRALRPQLVELCGEARIARTDRLELLARALMSAHASEMIVERGPDLSPLSIRVHARRELLKAEVDSLVTRGLLPATVTENLHRKHGYRNASFDVLQLVSALRSRWDAVKEKVGVTLADIDAAEGAAHQLAIGSARQARPQPSPAADLRMRAFTLFFATYEELRRAVHFLRWYEGDADRIAPPLWSGRPAKKSRARNGAEG